MAQTTQWQVVTSAIASLRKPKNGRWKNCQSPPNNRSNAPARNKKPKPENKANRSLANDHMRTISAGSFDLGRGQQCRISPASSFIPKGCSIIAQRFERWVRGLRCNASPEGTAEPDSSVRCCTGGSWRVSTFFDVHCSHEPAPSQVSSRQHSLSPTERVGLSSAVLSTKGGMRGKSTFGWPPDPHNSPRASKGIPFLSRSFPAFTLIELLIVIAI